MIIKINLIQIYVIIAFKLIIYFQLQQVIIYVPFFQTLTLILLLGHKFNNHHKINNYYQYEFKRFFFVISPFDYVTVNFYYS